MCFFFLFYIMHATQKTELSERGKMSFELLSLRYIANVSTFLWLFLLSQSWKCEPNSMLPDCMTLGRYPILERHSLECVGNNPPSHVEAEPSWALLERINWGLGNICILYCVTVVSPLSLTFMSCNPAQVVTRSVVIIGVLFWWLHPAQSGGIWVKRQ